jgi:hypothetical protein
MTTAEFRDQLRAVVLGQDEELLSQLDANATDPGVWLDLIVRANEANNETADILAEAVLSARAAGVSWEAIGSTLRISRQAAQQRFGRTREEEFETSRQFHQMEGLHAFNEMAELKRVGAYGWHSVGNGPLYHLLERDGVRWEHLRVTFLADFDALAEQGWRRAGTPWFPWVYLARPTREAALVGNPFGDVK